MVAVVPISILSVVGVLSISIGLFYYREIKRLNVQLEYFKTRLVHEEFLYAKIKNLYRFATFGRLSAGLFHDIANLFQNILIQIHQIEKSKDFESEKLSQLTAAHKRMGNFIQVAQKQLRGDIIHHKFSVISEIREVMRVLEYQASESNTKLTFYTDHDVSIYGNPFRFHQIFLNLIVNAIHALDCVDRDFRFVKIVLKYEKGQVVFSVQDNGCGISMQCISKIFDPFFSTKQIHTGIGLGLFITKEIVEKDFNGTISVESREGQGSIFTIQIPIQVSVL